MTPLAVTLGVLAAAGGVFIAGLGGAVAWALVDRRELAGRVPVVTPLGLLWLRFPDDLAPEHREPAARALARIMGAYRDALDALELVPDTRWASVMVEGMKWDLRRRKPGQRIVGQYLGYFAPRAVWTVLGSSSLAVGLVVHELEHMRDHILSGLTYREWANGNAAGRHHFDPGETARVIAWCTSQLGDAVEVAP